MSSTKNVRVFLVDDHPVIRTGICRLLESENGIVVVGEAESAEESLEKVDAGCVDVVLMDVQLPGINGIEATRLLAVKHPDLKVIILSAFGDQYLDQAVEAGAKGYMLKTATRQELVNAVLQVVNGQRPIDSNLTTSLLDLLSNPSRQSGAQGLSHRQEEVLRLIAEGVPSRKVMAELFMSHATLTREMRHIFNALGVDDRAHAVAEAYRRKIIS